MSIILMRQTGTYQNMTGLNSFTPFPLPPKDPPFHMSPRIIQLYGEASYALGQLNEMSARLPDPTRFIRAYIIKEALLTSSIEGIHTTLIDVFTQRLDIKPNKETQLVLNYTKCLEVALNMMQSEGFPLVNRVILKAHEQLFRGSGENSGHAGHFRNLPVRVGQFIPPSAPQIPELLQDLERFMNEPNSNSEEELPALIKAGLAHVQFETIHPFLDGNGRIGRLLIVLMLAQDGLLTLPCLYPSLFFSTNKQEYYSRLDNVRKQGDFEGWIVFYLKAIIASSKDALERAKDIEALEEKLFMLIDTDMAFAKMRDNAKQVLQVLLTQPISSIGEIAQNTGKAYNTIHNIFLVFMAKGVIVENTMKARNKTYALKPYLEVLEKEY